MREIKFRAMYKSNTTFDYYHTWESIRDLARYMEYGYIDLILQYTGLKDNNKTEIYEGDILKNNHGKTEVVVFNENGWYGKRAKNVHCVYNILSYNYLENKVVIGNIYENPELLNN
jgi:hypothetical protein